VAPGPVLEIGVGSGKLENISDDYIGLDISFESLKRIKKRPYICASAEQIPLRSESLSFIFSIATLEHIPFPERTFSEIDRCLSNRGILYLAPAWHCRFWASEGINVRPYSDLNIKQKAIKFLIPVLNSIIWRGLLTIPWRLARRVSAVLKGGPTFLKYKRLKPNYEIFWCSDSDATCSLDRHEAILYFKSRSYEIISHSSLRHQIFARGEPVIVKKLKK
jgi:SAM-dependent methyltransferase